jgi:hypothetical protein
VRWRYPDSVLPTFLVIGAYKAGTTSLYHYLRAHPQVFMTEAKETFYFTDRAYHNGLDWYESQFADAGDALARGEASTAYSAWPFFEHVPERAHALVPDAKLIYVLRHPIERLLSQYRFDARMWWDKRPIDEAVLDETRYVSRSRYAMQIDQWLPYYPLERMLFLTSEGLRDDRRRELRRAYEFLGVDPDFVPRDVDREHNRREDIRVENDAVRRLRGTAVHRAARAIVPKQLRHAVWRLGTTEKQPDVVAATISPAVEQKLLDLLRPDLERLPGFVGPDFDAWGLLERRG